MSDSVYKVVTLIGTSAEVLGEGGKGSGRGSGALLARTPHSGSRQAGHDGHEWQGGGLPDQGQAVVQI